MSNLHNGSKLRKKDVHSIREAILSMVQEANLRTLPERRVSDKAAITVANRDLEKTKNASVAKREFSALRAVGSFISLATINKVTEASLQNSDLLAIGHPFSTKAHSMTAASLRNERAKWIAADEYIDSSIRSLVIKAHGYEENSMERAHAFARLAAMGPGFVPITASIDLNTATSAYTEFVFGLGLGGNSDMARRLRAKMQRRDRLGRFAFMGGGFSFSFRSKDGRFSKVSGRVVGASGDQDSIDIEVKNHPRLADGIYAMPSSRGTAVRAILDDEIIKDLPQADIDIAADDVFVDEASLTRMMAPTGWTTEESSTQGGKAVSWVHKSEDGYEVYDSPGDPFGRFQLRREKGNGARQPFPKVKSWADVQKQAISDQDLYKDYLEKEQINQDKNKAFDEAAKSGEGPPSKALPGRAWVKHENGQWYERELGRNYDVADEELQKIAKEATGPYLPPKDNDFGKKYKTSTGKWKEWDEGSDESWQYKQDYQKRLNGEYSKLKRLQEAQKAGLFDPKSDIATVRDINGDSSVGEQLRSAITDTAAVRFNYDGKYDVQFTPKSSYVNKKTGKTNFVGLDTKGVQRTYAADKIAPPKSAAKTEVKATIPDAPEAPPVDTTPDVVDLKAAIEGMKLGETKEYVAGLAAKKQKVRFNYSGSERVVEPIEVWVNGQTGRINLRAIDKDVKKNFSFDKIEAPKPSERDIARDQRNADRVDENINNPDNWELKPVGYPATRSEWNYIGPRPRSEDSVGPYISPPQSVLDKYAKDLFGPKDGGPNVDETDTSTDFPMSPEERAAAKARPSERVTNLDGLKGDELTAAIDKAIADKKPLKFTYHEKERLVRPLEVWTNPKTGKVNLRAVEADADTDKNFTLEKIGKPVDEKIKQIDADDIINMPQEQLDDVVDALWPAAAPSQQVAPEATGRRIVDASSSTAVERVEYDPATKELFIQFKSSKDGKGGGVYKYSDVAPEFVDRLESGSIGKMIPELKKNNSSEKLDEFPAGGSGGPGEPPAGGPVVPGNTGDDAVDKLRQAQALIAEMEDSGAFDAAKVDDAIKLVNSASSDFDSFVKSKDAVNQGNAEGQIKNLLEELDDLKSREDVDLAPNFDDYILDVELDVIRFGESDDDGPGEPPTGGPSAGTPGDDAVDKLRQAQALIADLEDSGKYDAKKANAAIKLVEEASKDFDSFLMSKDAVNQGDAEGQIKNLLEELKDLRNRKDVDLAPNFDDYLLDVEADIIRFSELDDDGTGGPGAPSEPPAGGPVNPDKYETEYGFDYPKKVTDENGNQVSRVIVDVVTEDMSLEEIERDFKKKFPGGAMKVIRQRGTNGWPEVQYDVRPGDEDKLGKWYSGDLEPYDYAGDADALDDADTRNLPTAQDYMDDPAVAEDADAGSFFDEPMFDSLFDTPDGAYKLNVFEAYRPVGRTTEDSEDFTDDPDVLATKFDVTELGRALAQAVLPLTNDQATGYGNLPFESGDEPVKAEALYEALGAARMTPNLVLAGLYDSMLDPERGLTNVERITDVSRNDSSLDNGIDDPFTAEILPVADRSAEIDAAIALNEKIGSYRYASNGVQKMRDHSENNPKMLDIAKDLTQREDDDVQFDTINLIDLLDKYLPWASSSDADERDAFRGLWGMMMSLDGGSSIESDSRFEGFRREILSSFERRSGNPTLAQDDYDEFVLQYGGFPEFVAGKKAIADGQDDLSAETSAAAFFRLVKASSRPNTAPLWRSIGVAEGSSEFQKYTVPGSRFDMDPRSFTAQSLETGTFGDIAYSPTDKKIERVIFKLDPGDGDTISAESVSWFPDERENIAFGSFEVIEVTRQPSQLGKTRNDDYVVRIRKVDSGNQTDEQSALPAPGQFSEATQHGDISGWTQVGNQAGSNPGGFYDDPAGNSYYIKQARSQSHADNEALASAFYKELGVPAAEVGFGEKDGVLHLVTPLIDGATPNFEEKVYGGDNEYVKKVQDNFAVDAWLANYDIVGMVYDNVVSDANGEPVRVDPGGALMWRAQGKPKPWFGDTVDELDSMRDPDVNEQAANVFGTMSDDQIKASAQKVANLTPERIEEIIDSVVTSPDDAALLKERLLNRRQYIMDRFGFEEPTDVLGEPQSIASEMGIASKDLQAGDVTVGDSFVIERIFTDADTKKGKVSVQGYFPGHESQVKQWNENTVIMATRGGQLPAKGDAPALHRPVAPAKPQPAAFTGSIADELSGAQSWDEVRSILRGKTIVFFDYETTGFPDKKTGDKSSNQPAQLGAVKVVDGQIVDRFNLFMNPEEPLGGWSRDNLKGADGTPLTDEQLATALDKGEAHRQFIEWAGQDVILAAHNAPFDLGVMNETLGKKGLEYAPTGGVIDTLKLAQTVIASKKAAAHHVNKDQIKTGDPSGPDTHRLGDLASHFGVELGDGWHTADADSEATSNVLNSLIDYAAGADGGDTSLRSVLDAGDSYQSNMAEFEARSAQFKDELANYEIQKAIAAAWNCRGGTVASIAALIAAIDDPDCNVPSIDDLIKAATPGGTDFVDPEGLHTGDSSTGDAYTLEAEEIPEMDGVEPPFIPGIEDPDDEFRPSDQQQAVVEALFTGGDIVIRAAAGAGKTSTLKILARRLQKHKPKERVAYIAFNATVAAEARESMPSNVEVRTADSISVNWTKLNFPKLHKKKGAKDTLYSPSDIATHLKVPAMTGMDNKGKPAKLPVSESVKELRKAIYQFTISADKEIGPQHFDSDAVEASDIPKLVEAAERWWADILSENGKMLFSFPHMKKMWALSNPDLSDDSGGLKTPASVIFMDEAQDINPVLGRVIAAQTAQKVYVGDENQAIYQFMGAEDELQKVTVQHDLPLTKSYRFGEVIARNANRYLRFKERFLGEKKTFAVEGAGKFPGEIVAAGSMKNAQAVLVRSNAGAFREVRTELLNDRIVGVTKGFKADLDNFIIAVDWLQAPEATRGSRPMRVPEELRGYKNWAEIVDEAAKEGDSDFSRKTRILVDDVEQLGLEELKSLASRVKVLKGKVNTKVVDDGSLPDLPDDLSPGVEGDVGRDITFSVEEDAIVLRGSTYGVKDQIKTANGGPAKYDGDRKAWIIPAKTDKARQAGLEKLQKVLAPETVAEASYVDVVVSSVHQAKGAEWDEVRMGNDFFGPRKPKKSDGGEDADWIMPTPVELNLAYVGVTRAKKTLDPGSLNWIDSWVKSDDPEIMGLVDGVVVAPEAPEAPEAPTAASEDDSSAPTTSPDVDDEVAETAETIESVGEAVEGTNDPFGPGGEAPSAEQQAKDLEDSFNELSDYADSLTDPEGENNLKTGAKNKVKKAQKDLKQLQKDLEDGSITQAEATTKLQQMIAEFPDSDSNTEEALDMWTYRQTMIDLESVLTGERYMRPTGKGLPPRDAVDSKGRPVGFSKNGKFIRLGTRVRDKWGFSGTVDSYNENDWINVNVRYDIDPRDPAKVKKGKWGPGVARVSKNSRTLTVIEPGDREPWIDNGSVPENKKPKQIEEQTRIHLDMLEKRGETAWDGSEKDRQEPGGDLPKAEAPQGATEAPEESKASKAEFIKNSDFVDVLAEYYTTAKQAFNKGTLTKKDWDRVQSYFGSDSIAVNNFLRSGKRLWLTNDKDTIENVIKSIDDIFDVAGVELPGNVIVFRGIYDADKLFPDGVKPGDVFDDLGYSSTSIKSDVARTFTNTDETATVLAITVPSGTKMLANNTAIQAGQQKKEKEILLPRGLTFKVTSVTERTKPNKAYSFLPETYREIAVEIVSTPNAKAPKAEEIPAPPPWNPDVDAPEETAPTVANAKPSVELAAAADDARVSLDAYFDESFDKDDVEQATNSFSLKKTSHGQAADAVVYRKGADGFEVLMISREYGPFRGAMALPGGFRDGEESFADTADREMAEEVGIVAADAIKRTDLGTVLDSPDWDPRFVKGMSVGAVAYEVDGDKVEVTAGDDATGAVWIPVLDLANGKYPIAFGHATWLAEAFRDNRKYNRKFEIIKQASKERNTRLIEKINAVRSDLNEPVFEQYGPKAPDWVPEGPGRWRGAALTVDSDGVTIANGTVFDDVEKLKNGSLKPPVLPFFAPMGSEDAKDGDGYYFAKSGKRYWGRWGAEGVLLRKQGAGGEVQYLLGKRADWISSGGGKWAYPGGAHGTQFNAERGGTTGRAEILEELGVELSHPLVKGRETTALTYENPIEPDWTYRTVIIDASDDNVKQVQISDNETSEVGWFTADQIKEMNSQGMLHPSLNNNIEEILKLSEKTPVEKPVRDWSGLDIEKMETLPSGLASKKGISTLDEYFEAEEAFYSLIALDREFDAGQLAAMITQSLESSNAKKSMLDRWEKDHSMSASLEDQLTDYIDSSDKIGNSPIARWFETVDSDAIDQRQLQIEAGYEKYSGLGKIIERTGRPRVIPDVEQDFTKSNFAEIPSLMAAAQAVVNKKRASGSQEVAISAMVDSGDIEDLEVRASTVVDENGERKLRLRYTLTSWAGVAFGNRVAKDPDYRRDVVKMPSSFLNSNKDIVLDSGTAVWQFDEGVSYVWDSEDLGTVEDQKRPFTITFVQASDDPNQEELYLSTSARAPNALHNQVVIDLPLDATNAEITDALGLGGVRDPRPTTQKDLEIAVENRFLSLFGKMTDATQNAESQGKRQRMLDTIKADWGVSPSDVTVSVSSTGHIEYRIPEDVAIEIEKSTGVKYMNHSIFTSAYIKDYEKQNEKKPGYIDYHSMTPRQKADVIAEGLMKLIEAGGLMSTVSRYQEGRQFFGMSSNEDMGTGGADYVFLTPADDFVGSIGTPFREEDAAIAFNARNLLQRIDIYANRDDKYGERRESQDIISNIGVYTHEFMTKHGASLDDAKHMSVSRLVRESLLKKLAQKNISKIGGRDVEEVIVETGSKRTQDIIQSNSAGKDNILLFNNYLESIDAEPVNFNEYVATIEAASTSLEGPSSSYNKKTITYYPAPEGSVVLATRHATSPNMLLKDGDMLIVRHPDGTLWQYPAISTGDYSWGSEPNVMTDSGLAATITELRLPVPDAPDWTSKQYVPLGVQKYPKETQQIAAIESIKKGLADKTISKSSAIAKLIELAGMPITLASRAAVVTALDGMKDVTDPMTSAGQQLENIPANLSSFIERMETNNYIASPAILEMTSGEDIGSTRVVYSIRKEAISNGQGGKQIAVMAMTALGGMYFPLDLKTGLIFDTEKSIGIFSSRGIEYKIRGLSPSEQHKLL